MALTKTERTLVAAGTSNSAAGTTRARLDLTSAYGGILTVKMANGATGPTVGCTCNVLIAHSSTLPAAGSAGADWKTIVSFANGTTSNLVSEQSYPVGPEVMHLEVEFTGNTAQAVTVEAYFSEITSI